MIRRTLYTVPELPREARDEFRREAARRGVAFLAEVGEYFVAPENSPDLAWASDVAWEAYEIEIPSIAGGAKNLRAAASTEKSPRWIRLAGLHHRRAALIAENLPRGEATPLSYLRTARETALPPAKRAPPAIPRAGFFLLAPERAIAVFDSCGPYPGGAIPFAEEKSGPPSRAYLKLWEICARLEAAAHAIPRAGESTADLGSCPGGWTWALAELGAKVLSVDGAPLDPTVARRPEVRFQTGDAFRLSPLKVDWLFSDMICEPKRLPDLITRWRDAGCERFALSVKFKGEADEDALGKLRTLGGHLRHLRQNKHELTWFSVPGLKRI